MRNILLLLSLLLLSVGFIFAAVDSDGFNPNATLRTAPETVKYLESENAVPRYVQGRYAAKIARGNEIPAAYEFFERHKTAYRMEDPRTELDVVRIDIDNLGMRHVRFQQHYNGLPVVGANLIVHYTSDGVLKTVNGNYEPEISIAKTPRISGDEAVRLASQDLESFFGSGNPDQPELVIFPWEGTTYVAWRLFLYSDSPMGRWEYFVDAATGDVIYKADRIMDIDAVGTGVNVMGDPRNHIDVDYTGSEYQMRDLTRQASNDPHGHGGQMPAGNYIQTNIAGTNLPGSIATDSDNYWDDPASQSPAVDGHVYSTLVYDYLLTQFNRNGYDDAGASMLCIVNYSGDGDNNAYWDGSRIVVWSWSSGWRSLATCPDVIAHEWGHAVTEYTSGLVYQKEPGALNESFSDMIGAAFEFFHDTLDTPDWYMGENGLVSGNGFRSLDNPHEFGDPDTYGTDDPYWIDVVNCSPSYQNDYCGVHTNSGVGNKWFSLLSDGGSHNGQAVVGIGVQNAMKVAYRANAFYWNSQTDYHEAALATMDAADDLDPTGTWSTRAAEAWTAVQVAVPLPAITFSYPDGVPSTVNPTDSTTFRVVVEGAYGAEVSTGTEQIHWSIDGDLWQDRNLTQLAPDTFEAKLPPVACGSLVEFYVSADMVGGGTYNDPDPASPYSAQPVTAVTIVFDDNFETDLGWTVSGSAADGQWERGVPVDFNRGDPPSDYDGSGQCYLTDNDPNDSNSDVDDGTTTLTSPLIDLSGGDAQISYARWLSNVFGASPGEDKMLIYISNDNGTTWIPCDSAGPTEDAAGGWIEHSFIVSEFLTPTANMRIRFDVADEGSGSVVEGGLDQFSVKRLECTGNSPSVLTTSLPEWTVGVNYSQQLFAGGGSGNLTWTDLNGDLVGTGLSLNSAGLLSGTPTIPGDITFTARVTDESANFDDQPLTLTINAAVTVTDISLPEWTAEVAYPDQQLSAAGGTGSHTFTDKNGDLAPAGMTLAGSGLLTGTPAAEGTVNFTVLATDAVSATGERAFAISVNAPVTITTSTLPDGKADSAYSEQLTSSNGTGSHTFTEVGNNLAAIGLSLASNGALAGTPVDTGTFTFDVEVTDAVGSLDQATLNLYLNPAWICADVNHNGEGPNVEDLTYLVDFLFRGGDPPPIMDAADIDGAIDVNVSDLTYLVSFLFANGNDPACP